MSTALQCPSCGCNHRLDSVVDTPVFNCARCSRPLKVPTQYVAGNGVASSSPRSKPSGGRPAASRGGTPRLPLRILAWIVAFVLGAVVVRFLAKWTGFVGGDTVINLLIDKKITTYLRLAALVPVWALFATVFATLILEGPRWWARRKAGGSPSPKASKPAGSVPKPARMPATSAAAAGGAAAARKVPTHTRADTAPTRTRAPAAAAGAAAGAVDEYDERAASGQRPRRIPRRETGS